MISYENLVDKALNSRQLQVILSSYECSLTGSSVFELIATLECWQGTSNDLRIFIGDQVLIILIGMQTRTVVYQ